MDSYVYEFDDMLEKGTNVLKKEKDLLKSSVLNPNNPINNAKIEMKYKNDIFIAYFTLTFKTNMGINHKIKCKHSYWSNGLALRLLGEL